MIIETAQIITVTEANQNFSRATRIADEKGAVLLFKNNRLKSAIRLSDTLLGRFSYEVFTVSKSMLLDTWVIKRPCQQL